MASKLHAPQKVITSKTRSTFISGRVKRAKGRIPQDETGHTCPLKSGMRGLKGMSCGESQMFIIKIVSFLHVQTGNKQAETAPSGWSARFLMMLTV